MSETVTLACGALVDAADLPLIEGYKWKPEKRGYIWAWYSIGQRRMRHVWLHRLILNAPKEMQVDHINGDRLDNRRRNLRLCSNRENCRNQTTRRKDNTSGYKGVSYSKRHRKWVACIAGGAVKENGKRKNINLGYFCSPEEAAFAYDAAARAYFGEFARCNFVGG